MLGPLYNFVCDDVKDSIGWQKIRFDLKFDENFISFPSFVPIMSRHYCENRSRTPSEIGKTFVRKFDVYFIEIGFLKL